MQLEELPDELLLQILFHLPLKDCAIVSQVNKRFYNICNEDALWYLFCGNNYECKKKAVSPSVDLVSHGKEHYKLVQEASKRFHKPPFGIGKTGFSLLLDITHELSEIAHTLSNSPSRVLGLLRDFKKCEKAAVSLIQHGIDYTMVSYSKTSVLHYAAASGSLVLVELLVKLGMDILQSDTAGENSLHYAIHNKSEPVTMWLIDQLVEQRKNQKISSNNYTIVSKAQSPPLLAVKTDQLSIVKKFVESGLEEFSVNAKSNSLSLLHQACYFGRYKIVRYLLDLPDIDLNVIDNCHFTPLHNAARRGYTKIVSALIEAGADVNAVDKDNLNALELAAICSSTTDTLAVLIPHYSKAMITRALQVLCKNHFAKRIPDSVRILATHGDANDTSFGPSALHLAITHNQYSTIALLCSEFEVDLHKIDPQSNQNAYQIASPKLRTWLRKGDFNLTSFR